MAEQNPPAPNQEPPTEERPHKPADDREEIYFEGSPMLRGEIGRLLVWWLAALVLIVGPIVLAARKTGLPWWLTLLLILMGVAAIFLPILLVRSIRYRISNYRIDFERGILSKTIDTLELWHVEDLDFHQSLFDRLLSVGTITIVSHDESTPKLPLKGIPNPRQVFESLKQRVIAVKRQRGVIKMDIG